MLAKTRKEL